MKLVPYLLLFACHNRDLFVLLSGKEPNWRCWLLLRLEFLIAVKIGVLAMWSEPHSDTAGVTGGAER